MYVPLHLIVVAPHRQAHFSANLFSKVLSLSYECWGNNNVINLTFLRIFVSIFEVT